jgi:hypothetical protein
MTELPWGSPAAIARMTLPQLACLMSEKSPGKGTPCRTAAEYFAAEERIAREQARWDD